MVAATRPTFVDILCPASHSRDYHALQPIIRGRTCRAPAHFQSNFSRSTGEENADHPVPFFLRADTHSHCLTLSTPMRWLVQPVGTNPVPGMFAGGGGTVAGCTFNYILNAHSCSGLGFQARTPRARLTDTSHLIHRLTTNIMTKNNYTDSNKKVKESPPEKRPDILGVFLHMLRRRGRVS